MTPWIPPPKRCYWLRRSGKWWSAARVGVEFSRLLVGSTEMFGRGGAMDRRKQRKRGEQSFGWRARGNEQCKAWATVIREHADDKSINRNMQREGQRLFPFIWFKSMAEFLYSHWHLRTWTVCIFSPDFASETQNTGMAAIFEWNVARLDGWTHIAGWVYEKPGHGSLQLYNVFVSKCVNKKTKIHATVHTKFRQWSFFFMAVKMLLLIIIDVIIFWVCSQTYADVYMPVV